MEIALVPGSSFRNKKFMDKTWPLLAAMAEAQELGTCPDRSNRDVNSRRKEISGNLSCRYRVLLAASNMEGVKL